MEVGVMVRELRKELKMSQEQLARRAAVPQPYLSRLEAGMLLPNLATVEKILSALFCSFTLQPEKKEQFTQERERLIETAALQKVAYMEGLFAHHGIALSAQFLQELRGRQQEREAKKSVLQGWDDPFPLPIHSAALKESLSSPKGSKLASALMKLLDAELFKLPARAKSKGRAFSWLNEGWLLRLAEPFLSLEEELSEPLKKQLERSFRALCDEAAIWQRMPRLSIDEHAKRLEEALASRLDGVPFAAILVQFVVDDYRATLALLHEKNAQNRTRTYTPCGTRT